MTDRQYEDLINELKQSDNYPNRKAFRTAFDSIMGTLLAERESDKIARLKCGYYKQYREYGIEKNDLERISEYREQNPISKLIRR